ncbi:branched-chain amino acid ABC transporter permease [Eoetvoesiella caeni]
MAEFIQISVDGLVIGTIYGLIALGFSIVYRVTGAINLAQGGFVVISALIGFSLTQVFGMPAYAGLPLAVIVTTVVGTALGSVTFVPALGRLSNSNVLMITVGILTMLEGLSFVVWGSQPYAPPVFSGKVPVSIGNVHIPTQDFWVLATVAVVLVGLWYLIGHTRLGRALRACSENPMAASLVGVNVSRVTVLSFMLATALAAIAGVVVAPTTTLQFDTGRLFTISGFIAVVIGGLSSAGGGACRRPVAWGGHAVGYSLCVFAL